MKKLWLFASFILIIFFVASALRSRRDVDRMLMLIVGGGAIVAFCSIIEWRTHFNPFNHLDRFIPLFRPDPSAVGSLSRGDGGAHDGIGASTRSRSGRCSSCCCRSRSTCSAGAASGSGSSRPRR